MTKRAFNAVAPALASMVIAYVFLHLVMVEPEVAQEKSTSTFVFGGSDNSWSEILDVYADPTGNRVRNATSEEIHSAGLWHRAVYVFVVNSDGLLLVQQRSPTNVIYPGKWEVPGSHVRPEETFVDAAVRTIIQEIDFVSKRSSTEAFSETEAQRKLSQLKRKLKKLTETHSMQNDLPEVSVKDYEMCQSFSIHLEDVLEYFDVPASTSELSIRPKKGARVSAIRFMEISWLKNDVIVRPLRYTSWLRTELKSIFGSH